MTRPRLAGSQVSVVIPAHNAERYLGATLLSALSQSAPPLEVLVVDDHSTDATAQIARSFGPKVRVIPNSGPRGASSARNTGVKEARGDLIAFLDADDIALPERFLKQAAQLATPGGPVATFCDVAYIDAEGTLLGEPVTFVQFDPRNFFGQLVERNRIPTTSAVMARRSDLLRVGGFDEGLAFNEEYDLWLRLARTMHFGHDAKVLLHYRLHPGNISRDREGQRKNEALALGKFDRETLLGALAPLHGDSMKARLALALVYLRVGDSAGAAGVLVGCEKALGSEAIYCFAKGNILLLEGRYAVAAEFFTRALTLEPSLPPALNNLGLCLAQAGDFVASREAFAAALGLKPGYADAETNMISLARGDVSKLRPTLVPLREVLKPQLG